MKAALIVNARAGSLAALPTPRASLESALREAGFDLMPLPADAPLEEQWDAVQDGPAEVVFVAGGDGTLRDGATRLLGTPRILAPLPGGTMNRVCARLGLPGEPLAAARGYRPGPCLALDIGTANGEVFLYQSVVGAPTRLMRFREMQRGTGRRGWLTLARALIRTLLRPSGRALTIRTGPGRRLRGHAAVVTIPAPGQPEGLSLALARPHNAKSRLRQAWRWFRGRLAQDPDVAAREGERLAVLGSLPWLRLTLDGETRIATSPVRFRLHRGALRVLMPPGAA